jgi:DnaK suppressor protein
VRAARSRGVRRADTRQEGCTVASTSDIDLKQFEGRLAAEREALAADLPKAAEVAALFTRGDVLDPEDMSVQETERDVQLDVVNRRSGRLTAIDEALARIADGSFGRCVECDQPISPARLDADPAVALCIECQRLHEERNPPRTPEL